MIRRHRPLAMELDFHAFGGGVDFQTASLHGRETAGGRQHGVQFVVGAVRVVMEEDESLCAAGGGGLHHCFEAAMAPADAVAVFLGGVLGVMDEEADAAEGVDHLRLPALEGGGGGPGGAASFAGRVGQRCGAGDLVVRNVGKGTFRGVEAEGHPASRVIEAGGGSANAADPERGGAKFLD